MLPGLFITVFVIGIASGHAFRAFVLVPMSFVLAILSVSIAIHNGSPPWLVPLATGAAVGILQFGYLLGLVSRVVASRFWRLVRSSEHRRVRGHVHHSWVGGRRSNIF